MRGRGFIAALAVVIFAAVPGMEAIRGQQGIAGTNGGAGSTNGGAGSTNGGAGSTNGGADSTNGTDAKPKPAKAGSYSLVITTLEPTTATHWLNPPPTINVGGGTKLVPAETTGNLTMEQQYTIEAFDVPRQECVEALKEQHGCDALDRTDLTIRDANTVEYRIVNHGAAVQLRVNLQVHDLLPVARGTAGTDWHARDVIFVSVPKATPVYRFVSETLVGEWSGEAIVFEAGKPLPESAKKGLEDLGVHQDLGDAVLYSYRVK